VLDSVEDITQNVAFPRMHSLKVVPMALSHLVCVVRFTVVSFNPLLVRCKSSMHHQD
jgi:hypothetical protein